MGLTYTHNPVSDTVTAVREHPELLPLKALNNEQLAVTIEGEGSQQPFLGHVGNGTQLAPEVPELLANALSKFRLLGLSGFGDAQIRSSCLLPIGARLRLRARPTDMQEGGSSAESVGDFWFG